MENDSNQLTALRKHKPNLETKCMQSLISKFGEMHISFQILHNLVKPSWNQHSRYRRTHQSRSSFRPPPIHAVQSLFMPRKLMHHNKEKGRSRPSWGIPRPELSYTYTQQCLVLWPVQDIRNHRSCGACMRSECFWRALSKFHTWC